MAGTVAIARKIDTSPHTPSSVSATDRRRLAIVRASRYYHAMPDASLSLAKYLAAMVRLKCKECSQS